MQQLSFFVFRTHLKFDDLKIVISIKDRLKVSYKNNFPNSEPGVTVWVDTQLVFDIQITCVI